MAEFVTGTARHIRKAPLPPLRNGDRLDQKSFHERYEAMPAHVRAELIGGVVYMASPQKLPHGRTTVVVGQWLVAFVQETPGTEILAGVTNILGPKSEPEPDHCLLILPEYGGQTSENEDEYLTGTPELIIETGAATQSRDLNQKKRDYEQAGVREYVVVGLRSRRVFWFALRGGKFAEVKPGPDGILRSRVFPGLWLDPDALLKRDWTRLFEVLRQGLASEEHQAFVEKLARRKRREKK
jgi:hypothetical protein